MKTLTIKQPWASLIAHGIKDIENRTWKTNYRGRVLIHASAKQLNNTVLFSIEKFNEIPNELIKQIDYNILPKSAIIGSVEIVDCVINHPSIWAERCDPVYSAKTGNICEATYNWVLANSILFDEPIFNVKGRLSFWDFEIENEI